MDLSTCASAGDKAGGFALVPGHTNSRNHQSYSNISAHDGSRLHLGNNYYVTYSCSASHEFGQPLLGEVSRGEDFTQTSQKRKRSADDCGDAVHRPSPRQSLAVVLESLGEYSKSMQQLKEGDKGKEIAAQLRFILASLSQAGQGDEACGELDKEVQKLQHQLQGARRIKINGILPKPMVSEVHKAHSTYHYITVGHWIISLTTKTLTSRAAHGLTTIETCSVLHVQHCSRGSAVSAFFGERDSIDHVTTLCPVVTAYNQVSNDSEVFRTIKKDSLADLLRLLATGEASMRDCDEEGRSLLHYACGYLSSNICKFLIESGTDIDRRGPQFSSRESCYTPLAVCYFRTQISLPGLEAVMRCSKLLLQAGADPTLMASDPGYRPSSPLFHSIEDSLAPGTSERCAQILRESMPYFDLRTFREHGNSIWQTACRAPRFLASCDVLPFLVNAGVDTEETNELGQNCLFECALHVQVPQNSEEFTALYFLLTVNDKIFARDSFAKTIFDYLPGDEHFEGRLGSYQHDLWYCALYRSGLARRFEIPPPFSKIVFTTRYRVKHYRALLYLDSWDIMNLDRQLYPFADNFPSSAEERQQAPAFQQWDLSDLLRMEQRALSDATCEDLSYMYDEYLSPQSPDISEDESSSQFSDTAEEDSIKETEN